MNGNKTKRKRKKIEKSNISASKNRIVTKTNSIKTKNPVILTHRKPSVTTLITIYNPTLTSANPPNKNVYIYRAIYIACVVSPSLVAGHLLMDRITTNSTYL